VSGRGKRRGRHDDALTIAPSTTVEPCIECHDETAAGSALYSDRIVIQRPDAEPAYLCAGCHALARGARNDRPLSEAGLQTIGENGTVIGLGLIGI
jgi:hypothetical protein